MEEKQLLEAMGSMLDAKLEATLNPIVVRLDRLEQGQAGLTSAVSKMQGDITKIQGDITEIRGDITEIRGDITEIRGDITNMQGDITKMQGDITKIQGDITKIQGDITEVREDVAELKEAHEATRDGVNRLLEWADECGYIVKLPLPQI